MKYAFEMGSGAIIYALNKLYKNWFSHSKVARGIHRHTDSMVIA
jgi:hypothetical protein